MTRDPPLGRSCTPAGLSRLVKYGGIAEPKPAAPSLLALGPRPAGPGDGPDRRGRLAGLGRPGRAVVVAAAGTRRRYTRRAGLRGPGAGPVRAVPVVAPGSDAGRGAGGGRAGDQNRARAEYLLRRGGDRGGRVRPRSVGGPPDPADGADPDRRRGDGGCGGAADLRWLPGAGAAAGAAGDGARLGRGHRGQPGRGRGHGPAGYTTPSGPASRASCTTSCRTSSAPLRSRRARPGWPASGTRAWPCGRSAASRTSLERA